MDSGTKEKLIACRSVLAELEKASGADIWLDRTISVALDQPWDWSVDWRGWGYDDAGKLIEQEKAFPYTASLDATIALVDRVLPGWDRRVEHLGEDGAYASVWKHGWHDETAVRAEHRTSEPIALLTAMFRAKIAQMEKA